MSQVRVMRSMEMDLVAGMTSTSYSEGCKETDMIEILEGRKNRSTRKGQESSRLPAKRRAWPGSVSQRACVFCGSRVVLYPDRRRPASCPWSRGLRGLHLGYPGLPLVGTGLHRLSFSTDLREKEVDLRRREEALRGPDGTDRALQAQGGLRLCHLHRRPHRRRCAGGLQQGSRPSRVSR